MSDRAADGRDERPADGMRHAPMEPEAWTARLPDEDDVIPWDEHEGMLEWGALRPSE